MGRHAGWLTAAAALAQYKGNGPDLIYVPEVAFDMDKFLETVKKIYDANKKCIVAVSEGIHDAEGTFITEYANKNATKDSFGHAQLGGLAAFLANEVKKATGAKVRGIELSLLQRCAAHSASKTDVDESFMAGKAAVENAVSGVTDKMVGFERVTGADGKYECRVKLFDLDVVANAEKKLPPEWINETGDGIGQGFIDYALPLIQGQTELPFEDGLPRFVKLRKVRA
jgi:6-phosphofructokinase 1